MPTGKVLRGPESGPLGYVANKYTTGLGGYLGTYPSAYIKTLGALSGVTQDALSGKYFPANATEWAVVTAIAGVSAPSSCRGWQDASGSITDSIGTAPLTQAGTVPTYTSAIPGYTRKGVAFTDGSTTAFSSTAAALPDVSATSILTLVFAYVPAAPAATRGFVGQGVGGTTMDGIAFTSVPKWTTSGSTPPTSANSPVGAHIWALRHNKTATTDNFFTEQEKLSATYLATQTGKQQIFGNGTLTVTAPAMTVGYDATWYGSAAEMTDAQLRLLLQTLGWSVAW